MSRSSEPLIMLCLLSLSAISAQVHSQEPGDLDGSPVAEAESQFLFINMLEFLGEFETETGEWVSPDILENDAFADLDAGSDAAANVNTRGQQRALSGTGDEDE